MGTDFGRNYRENFRDSKANENVTNQKVNK